jgi:hypothetical protein
MFVANFILSTNRTTEIYTIGIYSTFEEANKICFNESLSYLQSKKKIQIIRENPTSGHIFGIFEWFPHTTELFRMDMKRIYKKQLKNLSNMQIHPNLSGKIKKWLNYDPRKANEYIIATYDTTRTWSVGEVSRQNYKKITKK